MLRLIFSAILIIMVNIVLGQAIRILFVGNSLTYTNNLPEMVKNEAKRRGYKVKTTLLAFPNYAIIDHWNDGELQKRIMSKKFDFVVVQQGPSSQPESRRTLLMDGAKLKKLCDKYDTRLAYFMVWPSLSYYQTFNGVIKNYSDAAKEHDAILCPVGKVWKAYFDEFKDFSLYGSDGFHPSPKGSRLAARVILDSLFRNESP